jgi:hypothetical protein
MGTSVREFQVLWKGRSALSLEAIEDRNVAKHIPLLASMNLPFGLHAMTVRGTLNFEAIGQKQNLFRIIEIE